LIGCGLDRHLISTLTLPTCFLVSRLVNFFILPYHCRLLSLIDVAFWPLWRNRLCTHRLQTIYFQTRLVFLEPSKTSNCGISRIYRLSLATIWHDYPCIILSKESFREQTNHDFACSICGLMTIRSMFARRKKDDWCNSGETNNNFQTFPA
jgi:hypothetical protein